jgi:glyoxylase-like metal-dependent hydrolase (beta-lactamase superfamily II)/ferredoxin
LGFNPNFLGNSKDDKGWVLMADYKKSVPQNVAGEFFVDSTCIDCDTCRQLAPAVFEDGGNTSFVQHQPQTAEETRLATQALLACPTGSIGTIHKNHSSEVMDDFPLEIEGGVFYCGFNSPKSYGGNSYFIRHPSGNWLVDSPKFLPHLVRQFEGMGGLRYIFLTHQDDVADAAKYAERFKAKRIIHEEDKGAQPGAEILIRGTDVLELEPGFRIIPTPGHTEGHCVLLYGDKFLFTGDHLWWRRKRLQLGASQSVAWYSWRKQAESMERLLRFDFEWVLPGHGQRKKLPGIEMKEELLALVNRMKVSLEPGWAD